jgi:integrase
MSKSVGDGNIPAGRLIVALTVKEIENAKPKAKRYNFADGGGLSLLIQPTGAKLWFWRYRFDGSEKNMHFGEYPHVPPHEARELHVAAKKLLRTGVNPMAERKAEAAARQAVVVENQRRSETSFESVAQVWWKWWSQDKSPRHAATVMSRLEADVFPAYGHKNVDEIEPIEIRNLMLSVAKRGARDVAKRIHETSGQIFRYAIANGLGTKNPTAGFRPRDVLAPANSENFARVDERDLPELLVKMENYKGTAITCLAMKLMTYTFVRTNELIEAPWVEFDLEGARWIIPKERMKMKTPHIVPLSRQSVEVLRALKLLTGRGELVFPGANDADQPMSNNTILYALYRLGYEGRMTGHGFRGVASTILNEHGFEEEHVDLQLAHMKRNKVRAAYNHAKYLKQRTEMMQWWADYVDAQLAKGRLARVA